MYVYDGVKPSPPPRNNVPPWAVNTRVKAAVLRRKPGHVTRNNKNYLEKYWTEKIENNLKKFSEFFRVLQKYKTLKNVENLYHIGGATNRNTAKCTIAYKPVPPTFSELKRLSVTQYRKPD